MVSMQLGERVTELQPNLREREMEIGHWQGVDLLLD
jgi:hypothetical protein